METVKTAISLAVGKIHLELTTLIVPRMNDDAARIEEEAQWIASLSPDIPLHLSRFFPRHRMKSTEPTPIETIHRLANVAREHLNYVYTGNI